MKLLHAIASVDREGGGPIAAICALAPALRKLGCETEVASLDHPDRVDAHSIDAPVIALGNGKGGYRYSPGFKAWLKENIDRFDATIVHGIWTYHSLAASQAHRSSRRPYFVYPHGMLDPWFKRAYPLKHLKKLAYWTLFERQVLNRAQAALFTCDEERVLARDSFPGYHCREVVVGVGTPSDAGDPHLQREAFYSICPHLRGQPFVLFLGRLHPKKGLDLLIRAYAELLKSSEGNTNVFPNLVIAGPSATEEFRAQLLALSKSLHLKSIETTEAGFRGPAVTFCPMITGLSKWGALKACNAFILPSHQENFGIAVTEALSCGRPVLISDKVNIWREIERARAGLVTPDTVEGAFRLLTQWQKLSESQRNEMGELAAACFRQHFETDRVAQSLIEAVGANPPPSREASSSLAEGSSASRV